MEFRVLGPVEVVAGGQAVPVGGNRERTLLARLILSANQVVSSDALTEDLWSGAPPEGATQALWVTVSRLRKALREQGDDPIVTRQPGYLLEVDETAIDSCRFEALVEQGRRLAAAGGPAAAAGSLREALALWRGPALADVVDAPFAQAEAARLNEARLAALEERIEADLACGRHGPLVGELAGLTREHPLCERLWGQRMLALYRAGRQAEALRAYQDVRRFLGGELGIEPGEELRRLETAMLRHDQTLGWSPSEPAEAPVDSPTTGVVSFLFTDIVGSTELLQQLGDDVANDLHRRHFALLRNALDTHGGTEVKSLGDGLMAAFGSPLAAVRCAVTIQRAVVDDSPDGRSPMAVRVGLHAGEPIDDDDDYFGTPVVVAQRLCARARGGQILASSLVHGLVGNRSGCSFTPIGGLDLKGLAEPVAACEVVWAEQPAERAHPLPLALERESSTFVGRTDELRGLDTAWAEARAGRRQLVLLAGEPGIGKTRLAAEFARRTHAGGGAVVLFGRCDEGMGVPYQPFVEALGLYVRQAPQPALGRLAGELVRLVPEITQQVGDLPPAIRSDPEIERYRLLDAVAAWLSAVSAESPVVLVVDDLQWASRPSLLMLGHLLRSGDPLRLLVVATYRDTDVEVTADLTNAVADLMRQPGIGRVRLAGLDEAGVAAYMEAQARHELDDEGRALAATVHAETAGNPFFVSQVLRHLAETEAIVRRDGRWTPGSAPLGVPEGVREVIARRLSRLPAETGDLLALAAVIGDRFELDVLVRASSEPEVSTLRGLDPAITARLVTETGEASVEYRFVHALVRATLYDGLPPGRRGEFHLRAAEAIEAAHGAALDDDLPALAHHYARTGRAGRPAAIHYATRAGDQALARRAHHDAAGWYAQALDLLTSTASADDGQGGDGRLGLLLALGEAQRRAGDPRHREMLLDAARLAQRRGDGEALVRAALANQRGFFSLIGAVDRERVKMLEAALEACGSEPTPERARLLALLSCELHFANDPRLVELGREALSVARASDDGLSLAEVVSTVWLATWGIVPSAERAEMAAELAELTKTLTDPIIRFHSGVVRYLSACEQTNLEVAGSVLREIRALAEELGQPILRWRVAYLSGVLASALGRFDEMASAAAESLRLGMAAGQADALVYAQGPLSVAYSLQGRGEEAATSIVPMVEQFPSVVTVRAAAAWCCACAGRREEALMHATVLRGTGFGSLPANFARLPVLAAMSWTIATLGEVEWAREVYDLLLPHRDDFIILQSASAGLVSYSLGRLATTLGLHDEADQHFAATARRQELAGARGWLVHTHVEWARSLLARRDSGDVERAGDLLRQARETARVTNLPMLVHRAEGLLAGIS